MAGDGQGEQNADVVLELPEAARGEFKDPFGPLYTEVDALLAEHDGPIVTVGDIVTYHFAEAGRQPLLALVDGRTKRETAPDSVRERLDAQPNQVSVSNPAGVLTAELLSAIADALDAGTDAPAPGDSTTLVVAGEEDLATVPAVLAAPLGATVVYGQPDEGMVAVDVTEDHRERFRELFSVFDGDVDRALSLLHA
jgi:uncharacterized protein (UPF0218 family)